MALLSTVQPSFQRDFNPTNMNDLIPDYSVLFSEDLPAIQRSKLVKKCRQCNLLILNSNDLTDKVTPRCFPTRSIFAVVGSKGSISNTLSDLLMNMSHIVVPDFFLENLLDDCQKTQAKFNEAVANRLGLPTSYISQALLISGWANSSSIAGSFGNSASIIQQNIQAASSGNMSIISAVRSDSAQVISMVFAIQDMYHVYAPQFSDPVKCDVPLGVSAVVSPTFLNLQSYAPIQMLPILCDNPSNPFHYINDCRPIDLYFNGNLPNVPLPRLLIRPNCILPPIMPPVDLIIQKGENIIKTASEMAKAYGLYENLVKIVVAFMAKTYYNAIQEAKQVLDLIHENISAVKAGKQVSVKAKDFNRAADVVNKDSYGFPEIDFSRLPVSPEIASVYPDLIMDYDELSLIFGYRLLNFADRRQAWSSWDPQAPLFASPLGSYFVSKTPSGGYADGSTHSSMYYAATTYTTSTLDTTKGHFNSVLSQLRARDSDDVILIRPVRGEHADKIIAVPRNARPFTTFQVINALAYICRAMHTINKLFRKSSDTQLGTMRGHSIVFSSEQLNNFGIPLRTLIDNASGAAHKRQVSETEDNEDGLQEDRSRGKCAVCGVNYINYFEHTRSHVHISKYRELLQGLNIYKPLQTCASYSEYKVSIYAQLANIIMYIVTREQRQYDVVAEKLNECLNAMGSHIRVDPYDIPRSNSPTCRSSSFTTWRERTLRNQQHVFNDVLSKSLAYYGDLDGLVPDYNLQHAQYDPDEIGMIGAIVGGTGAFLRSQKSLARTISTPSTSALEASLNNMRKSFSAYCDLLMLASVSSVGLNNRLRATEIFQNAALQSFSPTALSALWRGIYLSAPIKVPFRGFEDLIPDRILYQPLHDIRNELVKNYIKPVSCSSSRSYSPPNRYPQYNSLDSGQRLDDSALLDNEHQNSLIDYYIFQNSNKAHHYDSFSAYNDDMYMFAQDYTREALNFRYGHFKLKTFPEATHREHTDRSEMPNSLTSREGIQSSAPSSPVLLDDVFVHIYQYLAKSFYSLPASVQNSFNVTIFSDLQDSAGSNDQTDTKTSSTPTNYNSQSRNLEAMTESIIQSQLVGYLSTQKVPIGLRSYNFSTDTPIHDSDGVDSSVVEASGSLLETQKHIRQPTLLSALLLHNSNSEITADDYIDDNICHAKPQDANQRAIEVLPYVPETILRDDVNTIDTYLGIKTSGITVKAHVLPGCQPNYDISSDRSSLEPKGDADMYEQDSVVGGFIKKLNKSYMTPSHYSGPGFFSDEKTPKSVSTPGKISKDITFPVCNGTPLFIPAITRILNNHLPLNQHQTLSEIYEIPTCDRSRVTIPPEYEIRAKQNLNVDDYIKLFFDTNAMSMAALPLQSLVSLSDDFYIPALLLQEFGGIDGQANPSFYPIATSIVKTIDSLFPVPCEPRNEDEPLQYNVSYTVEEDIPGGILEELAVDDSVILRSLYPRSPRPNSIPGPIRLSNDSISLIILSLDSPCGLDIGNTHTQNLLATFQRDLEPLCPIIHEASQCSDPQTVPSVPNSPRKVTGFYKGPQLYAKASKNRKTEESTVYFSTQFSGSDGTNPCEQPALPLIPVFSTVQEAHNTPITDETGMVPLRKHNYLTSIIREIDMRGKQYPQFCTIPWSLIYSINSGLITSYMLGNDALLNACFTFEAVSNSSLGAETPSAMIQPIHLAILHAGVTSKLRAEADSLGHDTFVRRKYTSKIVMEKHPRPAVYDCEGLEDEMARCLTPE